MNGQPTDFVEGGAQQQQIGAAEGAAVAAAAGYTMAGSKGSH